MKNNRNIYMPGEAVIEEVRTLTRDVKLYTVKARGGGSPRPGQFYMLSVMGSGEVPISVASTGKEPLRFCIRKVGLVTAAIHGLAEGDRIGLRGPYGNGFPLEPARGRDVVLVAGGLGIVPMRPLIRGLLEDRAGYGRLFLLYGAKAPGEVLFNDEAPEWEASGLKIIHTVDCSDENWQGCVGLVTSQLESVDTDFREAAAYVCGPSVMIDSTMKELYFRGMPGDRIVTTLEAHMKCGVGKCGHCYHGPRYICTDGPVFTYKELKELNTPGY